MVFFPALSWDSTDFWDNDEVCQSSRKLIEKRNILMASWLKNMSAIFFPLCVTSCQLIVTVSAQWSKETPMVRIHRRQGNTELSSLKKTTLCCKQWGWGWRRDVAPSPYLLRLMYPQEQQCQFTAVHSIARERCSSILTRPNTTKVLAYFIELTIGIIQLLIYLLFLCHMLNMPACQARKDFLVAWRILPVLPLSWHSGGPVHSQKNDWRQHKCGFFWVSRSGDKSSCHVNSQSQRTISILMQHYHK